MWNRMSRKWYNNLGRIRIQDKNIKVSENFKYLGSWINQDGKIDTEFSNRVQNANSFYQCVRSLIWHREVPVKCKMILFKTYCFPILTYAAETWTTNEGDASRIQVAEMKFLRSIVGKTRRDKIRNRVIRKQVGCTTSCTETSLKNLDGID